MTRWQFLKRHWVVSLIGLVILLVAVTTIVWAVVTREGDEGFLKNEDGRPLIWDRSSMPLICTYSDSVEKHLSDVDWAWTQIKHQVGDVIGICSPWMIKKTFPTKPVSGSILLNVGAPDETKSDGVYVSSPWDLRHGGTTKLYIKENGKLYGAIIYVNPKIPDKLRRRVWLHEFLHALGLGHDRLSYSIMFPTAAGRPKELSNKDIKRLQEVYIQ